MEAAISCFFGLPHEYALEEVHRRLRGNDLEPHLDISELGLIIVELLPKTSS